MICQLMLSFAINPYTIKSSLPVIVALRSSSGRGTETKAEIILLWHVTQERKVLPVKPEY
jgi:hypothetical protein